MMAESKRSFEISINSARNIIKVRAWGFWDVEFAVRFEKEFQKRVKEVNTSGKEWYILVDLPTSLTQSQEVQNIIRRGLTILEGQQPKKRAILADKSITLFRAGRLSQDPYSEVYSYFQSEDDAIQWLLNESAHK